MITNNSTTNQWAARLMKIVALGAFILCLLLCDYHANAFFGKPNTGETSVLSDPPFCINPDIPTLSASSNVICEMQGTLVSLSITSGSLNDATDWYWYSGSCGGTPQGTGNIIAVSPSVTTTYYVRGEGGCVLPGACAEITITVDPLQFWYLDADGDGLGDHAVLVSDCNQPLGYVSDNSDVCPFANQSTLNNFNSVSCDCDPGYYQVTTVNMLQTIITSCAMCPTITFSQSYNEVCGLNTDGQITISNESGGTGPYTYSIDNGVVFQSSNLFSNLSAAQYSLVIKDANGCNSNPSVISLADATPPVITYPLSMSVNNDAGLCGAVVNFSIPTAIDNCQSTVSGAQTFNYTGTVQTFTVPAGVTSINIDARGAQGGGSNGGAGGLGARMTGNHAVVPGQILNIVVPQLGNLQVGGNAQNSSGGGGGAFVYTTGPNTLLVAAGGGGGKCNYGGSAPLHPGAAGSITLNGNASSDGAALGGFAGNGGGAGLWSGIPCAGGGTGWLTNGGGPFGGLGFATWVGGPGFCGGGGGGCGGAGGFGGGGGGGNHYGGGGGGGGYSGGGGGTDPTHGGGGGSFSSGTEQVNTAGFQSGNGLVTITWNAITGASVTQTGGLPSGSTFPIGTTTNVFVATDANGNTSAASFDVTVTDTEFPIITCPSTISVPANLPGCEYSGSIGTPTASDNCPGVIVSGPIPAGPYTYGATVVTWTATDAYGHVSTCQQTVNVTSSGSFVINANPSGPVCEGTAVTLTASGAASFVWSGDVVDGAPFIPLSTATYTVTTGSDNLSCPATATLEVIVNPLPTPTIVGSPVICVGSFTQLSSSASYSSYNWMPGSQSTSSITANTAETYTLTVTDANACIGTTTLTTNIATPPPVSGGSDAIHCVGSLTTLTATGASSYTWSPLPSPLDAVSSASLAVGLHKLKSSYSGSAIQLRRSSDNATMDFGFVGDDLDVSAIATWLGVSTGYCTTLYDQSGNGNHIVQANAANQPTYVAAGINGKPILHFNTSQQMFNYTNFPPPFSVVYAARQTGPSRARVLSSPNNNWLLGWHGGSKTVAYFEGWISLSSPLADNDSYVYSATGDGSSSSYFENGVLQNTSNAGVQGPNGLQLNGYGNGFYETSDCDFMDVMVFGSVLSNSDRSLVENTTGTYYGISTPNAYVSTQINVAPLVNTTYTVTGTDANGCTATSLVTVTVHTPPVITCPSDVTVNLAANTCDTIVTYSPATATGDGPITYSYSQNSGTSFHAGSHTVTATATDANGCTSTCTFLVNVLDVTPPVITCPLSVTVNNDAGVCGAVVNIEPSVTDDCPAPGPLVTQTFNYTGSLQTFTVPSGVHFITVDARGGKGGSNTNLGGKGGRMVATIPVNPGQTYNVVVGGAGGNSSDRPGAGGGGFSGLLDGTIHLVSAGGGGGANGDGGCSSAGKGGDGGGTIGANGESGVCGTGGAGGVFSLTPLGGPGGSATYNGAPGNATGGGIGGWTGCNDAGSAGGGGGYGILGAITYGGNCSYGGGGFGAFGGGGSGGSEGVGGVAERVSNGGGGGGGFTGGAGGNNGFGCGSCGAGGGGGGTNYAIPSAYGISNIQGDNASDGVVAIQYNLNYPILSLVSGIPSGSVFPIGTTTNVWVATDAAGNVSSTCSATITVVDAEAPVVHVPSAITVNAVSGQCDAIVNYSMPYVSDNCCPLPTSLPGYTFLGIHNAHSYFLSTNSTTWTVAKNAAIAAGGQLASINSVAENTFLYNNAGGNHIFIGGFQNHLNPLYAEPGDGWEWLDGSSFLSYTNWAAGEPNNAGGSQGALQFYGNDFGTWDDIDTSVILPYFVEFACGLTPSLVAGYTSGSSFPVGTTTVTYSTTDANGLVGSASFNVIVNSTIAPVITCPSNIVTCDPVVTYAASATDDCGTPVITFDPPSGSTFSVGTTIVKAIATDESGNKDSCTFEVLVNPTPTPSISGTLSFCTGSSTTLDAGTFVGYDWSTGASTQSISVISSGTFSVTVTDGNGCTASTSVTTIANALPVPLISGMATICDGSANVLDAGIFAGYNWSTGETTQTISVNTAATFTVTVTDGNGCTASSSLTTTVNPVANVNQPVNMILCNGASSSVVNFSGSLPSLYSWTNDNPAIGLAAGGSGNLPSFTAINTGAGPVSATITVTPEGNNGSCAISAPQTFTNNTPVAIPTGPAVITSTILVSGAPTYLYDLNLQTFITHTFAADLDITITSPSGKVVTLTTDNGAGNDDVFNGTIWDDNANPGGQVPYATNSGLVTDNVYANLTLASPLVPEEPLGAFIGENPNGTWTITVSDDLAGDGGSLNSWSMIVKGLDAAPGIASASYTQNTAVAIPAGPAVVVSTLNVTGAGTVLNDVNLTTFITHTFAADLDMTITSPSGTVVTLTTDNGAGNDNVFNGTTWDDSANPAGAVPYINNNGMVTDNVYVNLVPVATLTPEEALSAFIGEDPNGIWTITISDDLAGDAGALNSWTLDLQTSICQSTCAGTPKTFTITVNVPTSGTSDLTNCNSYTWGSDTYTVSGMYTRTFANANGCDSIHTLNLTITNATTSSISASASGCYVWSANGASYTMSGVYTVTFNNASGCDSIVTLNLTVTPGIFVTAKAILAGPYNVNTGLMHDSLRVNGLIPFTEPYSTAPYNKTPVGGPAGETVAPAILAVTGPNAIVDWVMLEIRNAVTPSTVIANKRALLQRDGDIVSAADGVSPVFFDNQSQGNYIVSVKHRNHLGVMTASAVSLNACTITNVDFTTSSPVYTNPSITTAPRKTIGLVRALWSADANNNKNVKYNGLSNDKDFIAASFGFANLNNTLYQVYRVEDVNMDGKIRFNNTDNDRAPIIDNVGPSTPNVIINQHTPN